MLAIEQQTATKPLFNNLQHRFTIKALRTMMFGGGILSSDYQLVMISLAILSLLSVGSCQNCRLINASEVDSILSQVHPPSDWVVQPLQLVDYNITCLAVSSLRDRYRYTSVSVTYLNKNEALTAMLDVGCSAETDQWDPLVLGDDETFVWTSGVVAGPARRDCASCMNTAASDNLTHCVACDSDCTSADDLFGGCVDECGRQCCNVYIDGVCSESCPEGETIGSNFTCTTITTHSITGSKTTAVQASSTELAPSISTTITASTTADAPTTTSLAVSTTPSTTTDDYLHDQMLRITLLASILTSLVTTVVSVLLTLLIVACICGGIMKKKRRLPLAPATSCPRVAAARERTPSTDTDPEYIIPLTSPSTNTERSLGISDSLSMQYNLSYFRTTGEPVATAVYEYPETMVPLMPRHSPMSQSCPEVPLLGQTRDRQRHKVIVD